MVLITQSERLDDLTAVAKKPAETRRRPNPNGPPSTTTVPRLDAEISHYYHLRGGGGGRANPQNTSWKVVPFDEIAVYRSDPRHVTKLMSRSGGLGVVITAGTHGCDVV